MASWPSSTLPSDIPRVLKVTMGFPTAMTCGEILLTNLQRHCSSRRAHAQRSYIRAREKNKVPLMRDEEIIEYPVDQNTITKKYTEEAIAFIKTCKDEPFFLYLPHTMVHRPLHVSEAFAKTEGTGDALIHDAIEEIDWSVGEVLKAVKKAGIDENTLVIFTSDNGAAVGSSLPFRSKKVFTTAAFVSQPSCDGPVIFLREKDALRSQPPSTFSPLLPDSAVVNFHKTKLTAMTSGPS